MKIIFFFNFQKKIDVNRNLRKIVLLSKSIKVKILICNLLLLSIFLDLDKKISINKDNDKIIVKIISNCLQ